MNRTTVFHFNRKNKTVETERTKPEIHAQIDKAAETEDRSALPGMNYEQGVRAALEWVTGQSDELPMED